MPRALNQLQMNNDKTTSWDETIKMNISSHFVPNEEKWEGGRHKGGREEGREA